MSKNTMVEDGEQPAYWQWRRKSDPWSLEKTFNSEVFATTTDSEVRPLFATAQPARPAEPTNERMADALRQIKIWAEAYPLDVFPEPDMKVARRALEDAGQTLDAVSAKAMRHVITQVQAIVDATLPARPDPGHSVGKREAFEVWVRLHQPDSPRIDDVFAVFPACWEGWQDQAALAGAAPQPENDVHQGAYSSHPDCPTCEGTGLASLDSITACPDCGGGRFVGAGPGVWRYTRTAPVEVFGTSPPCVHQGATSSEPAAALGRFGVIQDAKPARRLKFKAQRSDAASYGDLGRVEIAPVRHFCKFCNSELDAPSSTTLPLKPA